MHYEYCIQVCRRVLCAFMHTCTFAIVALQVASLLTRVLRLYTWIRNDRDRASLLAVISSSRTISIAFSPRFLSFDWRILLSLDYYALNYCTLRIFHASDFPHDTKCFYDQLYVVDRNIKEILYSCR